MPNTRPLAFLCMQGQREAERLAFNRSEIWRARSSSMMGLPFTHSAHEACKQLAAQQCWVGLPRVAACAQHKIRGEWKGMGR